ncbi:sigma-54-dependent transcriptional regulator [Oleidesulfovibrio alaskensis]|jgi:two-component system NtrC family response regulator|uniref:sigma-54-dependent transcriptional regulator n=1 Tax=Oleidesulfovibrio alaskensis TaxID=58180 RepID=UPI0003FB75E5|nr:sigma-54 dependent transcriptional regulator [Oleidesulfovibrio alaskensis]
MRVLIIDDDEHMRHALGRTVRRLGCEPVMAGMGGEGLQHAEKGDIDAVFLDVRLPDGNGLSFLPRLAEAPSRPEVIIITGAGDPDGAELAITNGAWDYIEKTASIQDITLTLRRALDFRRERMESRKDCPVRALRRKGIVGDSPALMRCLDLVAQSAQTRANVLICGETGTGKELFARAIHENSMRSDGPFVVVDCAGLPENLVESILFGHSKGSFTGAEKDRTGLVQRAHGGTLFLDEVGELPLLMQKSFLRVLQERTVRPLGSAEEVPCDFRLVAATNRDLEAMVQAGEFRNDLLFRLRSILIDLPPLRDRKDDIPAISNNYLDRECARAGMDRKGCYADFFDVLTHYSWPGNVRELLHALDHALAAAITEPYLFAWHLPPALRAKVARARVAAGPGSTPPQASPPMAENAGAGLPLLQDYREAVLQQAESGYLRRLMAESGNCVRKAVSTSGLSQSRLYALLKKHNITTS